MATGLRAIRFVILMALFASSAAIGQTTAPPPGTAGGQPRSFDAAKQHRLAEISKHIGELQRAMACVQNSTDFDQMQACRPHDRQR
jgi:hypothetical protein